MALAGIILAGAACAEESRPGRTLGEPPSERELRDMVLRSERVLLRPGEFAAELGVSTGRSERHVLAAVTTDGDADAGMDVALAVEEVTTAQATATLRGGIFEGVEAFVSLPAGREWRASHLGATRLSARDAALASGVTAGLRATLVREAHWLPEVIATVQGRVPLHHESYGLGLGLTLLKSFDPLVLFATVSYSHAFARDPADADALSPRHTVQVSAGYAVALTESVSLSTTLSALFAGRIEAGALSLPRQTRYGLQFGLTAALAEGLYVEPYVGMTLNSAGNGATLGLNLPYTF